VYSSPVNQVNQQNEQTGVAIVGMRKNASFSSHFAIKDSSYGKTYSKHYQSGHQPGQREQR
jgi:hypothetical protein